MQPKTSIVEYRWALVWVTERKEYWVANGKNTTIDLFATKREAIAAATSSTYPVRVKVTVEET